MGLSRRPIGKKWTYRVYRGTTEVIEALRGFFIGIPQTKVDWGKSLP